METESKGPVASISGQSEAGTDQQSSRTGSATGRQGSEGFPVLEKSARGSESGGHHERHGYLSTEKGVGFGDVGVSALVLGSITLG